MVDLLLVGDNKQCTGIKHVPGVHPHASLSDNVNECANKCNGISSMFIFGTGSKCYTKGEGERIKGGCHCACELSTSVDGRCNEEQTTDSRLYKFIPKGKFRINT